MSDDIDDLVKRAMKSLDDRAPAGYFETFVSRTLARLEDDQMETTSGKSQESGSPGGEGVKDVSAATGVPKRDDDSGLHDIRSLANTAKQRAVAKRTSQIPSVSDDDMLSSASGAWKNIALPEPAKMVSLPDLAAKADLPSKKEVKEAERQHREAQKAKKTAEPVAAEREVPAVGTEPVAKVAKEEKAAAAVDIAEAREKKKAAAVVAPKPAGNRKQTIAVIGGAVLAVAAAGIFFLVTSGKKSTKYEVDKDHDQVAAMESKAAAVAPVAVAAAPAPAAAPIVEPIPETPPAPVEVAKAEAPKKDAMHKTAKGVTGDDRALNEATTKTKAAPAAKAPGKGEEGDPSFDALLKEAGVSDQKHDNKPSLEKKKLTGGDFMGGMKSIEGKANGCYQGTQGTATVHVAIDTTGKITKVSVAGPFAGTPVADCVANAVRTVSFPPWDGAPESFNYSFLLSE